MSERAFAIVRPDGRIQKISDVRFASVQLEIYQKRQQAEFVRDKAYPSSEVVELELREVV